MHCAASSSKPGTDGLEVSRFDHGIVDQSTSLNPLRSVLSTSIRVQIMRSGNRIPSIPWTEEAESPDRLYEWHEWVEIECGPTVPKPVNGWMSTDEHGLRHVMWSPQTGRSGSGRSDNENSESYRESGHAGVGEDVRVTHQPTTTASRIQRYSVVQC